jgi:hypothetical protein
MTLAAAMSIWSVVVVSPVSRAVVVCMAWCVSSYVVSLPSRYWSIKLCGMGSMNDGWLCGGVREVALCFVGLDVTDLG